MALPTKLGDDFPEPWNDFLNYLQLSTSLVDDLHDHMKKRYAVEDLSQIKITPKDELDVLLAVYQKEILDLKEDNKRITNALKSLDDTLQVLTAMLKPLIQKEKKKRNARKRTDKSE